ncbi:hypothetical protein OGAPHI_004182 [Ogataea philodendri]|uniref:4-hydroxyphenylpyruvate dioxygenase n=1 Tax=Ogataea philodendri TaxID=1378263 RepID=A0A9P8P540_9ASCO|nr:uncharacterized protein OGAPHI_004182 [Ogataea philodendri]KAH3665993.1 hypothetical protein OGAPHI_004182 [Ogataea philodendri]
MTIETSVKSEADLQPETVDEDFKPDENIDPTIFGGYDHITFYVSSANIAAHYFVDTYGFKPYCFRGLETGSRVVNARVIKNGNVLIQFVSSLRPPHAKNLSEEDNKLVDEIHHHTTVHGDGVKDVAFQVSDVEQVYERALSGGATSILKPTSYKDANGTITLARVGVIGDTTHTLVDRSNYSGFLPGGYKYYEVTDSEELDVKFDRIDHCVQNLGWNKMVKSCEMYRKVFGFHKFWSVDDKQVYTEFSALKSTVMASPSETIKMPVNEPARGLKKSQIEEFLEFYGGPGIQHVALKVDNILDAVATLRSKGVEFIDVPEKYYKNLEEKLKNSTHPEFKESMEKIKELGILVDFDEEGYLLQLFTRSVFDRPTFFFEVIQRNNHNGFGAGNFKGLFEVLEEDQKKRGNLIDQDGEIDPYDLTKIHVLDTGAWVRHVDDWFASSSLELSKLALEPVQRVILSDTPVKLDLSLGVSASKIQSVREWSWDTVTTSNQHSLIVVLVRGLETVRTFDKHLDWEHLLVVGFGSFTNDLSDTALDLTVEVDVIFVGDRVDESEWMRVPESFPAQEVDESVGSRVCFPVTLWIWNGELDGTLFFHDLASGSSNTKEHNSGNSCNPVEHPDSGTCVVKFTVFEVSSVQPSAPQEHDDQDDVSDPEHLVPVSSDHVCSQTHSQPARDGCNHTVSIPISVDSFVILSTVDRLQSHGNRVNKNLKTQNSSESFVESDESRIWPSGDPLQEVVSSWEQKQQREQVAEQDGRSVTHITGDTVGRLLEDQVMLVEAHTENSVCQHHVDEEQRQDDELESGWKKTKHTKALDMFLTEKSRHGDVLSPKIVWSSNEKSSKTRNCSKSPVENSAHHNQRTPHSQTCPTEVVTIESSVVGVLVTVVDTMEVVGHLSSSDRIIHWDGSVEVCHLTYVNHVIGCINVCSTNLFVRKLGLWAQVHDRCFYAGVVDLGVLIAACHPRTKLCHIATSASVLSSGQGAVGTEGSRVLDTALTSHGTIVIVIVRRNHLGTRESSQGKNPEKWTQLHWKKTGTAPLALNRTRTDIEA